METVIIVVHLMVVIALVAVVLIQRSEGGALGIGGGGGGGGGGLFSSRGTANVLTRTTGFLAIAFFATSIGLTVIARNSSGPSSVLDAVSSQPASEDSSSTPDTEGTGEGILNTLKKQTKPSGPQVPASQ